MTLEEAIRGAVARRDARLAGRVVDVLRAAGWTYRRILSEVVRLCPGVEAGEWDGLLEEADRARSLTDRRPTR